ncbi:MAG TPA: DUF3300 domain-containing protein [Alphaproteobacteria bacterium]|nr:DUF3300 domain-containing protein [Alphaproteobacteria bacterium]
MKKVLAVLLAFCITAIQPLTAQATPGSFLVRPAVAPQDDEWNVSFSNDQLENLLAPIALYPDPLLAQVLLASTFPDQIDEAARMVRAYGGGYDIDDADWDVSVKAVAHYPSILSMMADKIDWTTSLGQAYVNQSTDVMEAVQRLRVQARAANNLVSTPQQEIVETDGYIYIYPAQPQYIYVPVYDPAVVYFPRRVYSAPVIWFGVGLVIGAWLNHDCDWGHRRIYYHGWEHGPAWVERSRPRISITNIYVNNNYRNVVINRRVVDRNVNYRALDRYNAVHRDVDYNNVRRNRVSPAQSPRPSGAGEQQRDNKIIRRNIDPNDPRINSNRGRGQFPNPPQTRQPETTQPQGNRPDFRRQETPRTQPNQPAPQPQARPDYRRPDTPRTQPSQPTPQPPVMRPDNRRQDTPRTQPNQPVPPFAHNTPGSVFKGNQGPIDARDASRRGQESRQQQNRPAAGGAGPAPKQQAPNTPPARQDRGKDRRQK